MARIKEEFCKVSVGRRVLGVCKEEQKDSLAGNAIQEVIAVGWGRMCNPSGLWDPWLSSTVKLGRKHLLGLDRVVVKSYSLCGRPVILC